MELNRKEYLQEMFAQNMMDEESCAQLLKCDSPEKVCELFASRGIDITVDEVEYLNHEGTAAIADYKQSADGELEAEDLEAVVGGASFWRGVASLIGGAVVGAGLGVACGVCPAFTPVAYKVAVGYSIVAGVWTAAG